MLVYEQNEERNEHVTFIEYTGEYPNLCSGILTLNIDGETVRFGHDYCDASWRSDGNFSSFWSSGGYLDSDYCAHSGEWKINVRELPEQYKKYAEEIDQVFNSNVPYGCCGGCA